jgi:4-diphosphocytidyl-2-C-methyl-D-erythritol kinase
VIARPDADRPSAARVAAQAKINLRLRMLARGTTGYHELETIFLRLDLADDVIVRVTSGARTLDVSGDVDRLALGPETSNLAWRAATAYADRRGWPAGFAVELRKRIPIGGGLGGGSADAAAVLRALDALAPEPVGEPALLEIAQRLGADVPFLASSSAFALAWGRGQRMLALDPPEPREVLLVVPPFGVGTAEAYRWFSESRDWARHDQHAAGVLDADALREWPTLAALAANDFRSVVHGRHPMLDDVEECLRRVGCDPVMLSGSGSTVFGVLPRGTSIEPAQVARDPAMGGSRVLLTRTATGVAPVLDAA